MAITAAAQVIQTTAALAAAQATQVVVAEVQAAKELLEPVIEFQQLAAEE